jgi:hypothetical protein
VPIDGTAEWWGLAAPAPGSTHENVRDYSP